MKKISCFLAFLFVLQLGFSQSYNSAAGLRLGTGWGLTYAQRFAKKLTVEGILTSSFQRNETTVTGLVRQHYPVVTKRLNVYSGAGLHKGWVTNGDNGTYKNPFGITGVLGAEFTIARFNISYDFRPSINISGGEKTFYGHTGIAIRYVLVKRKIEMFNGKNKKKKKRNNKKRNWKFWE